MSSSAVRFTGTHKAQFSICLFCFNLIKHEEEWVQIRLQSNSAYFSKLRFLNTGNSSTLEHREIIYAFTDRAGAVSFLRGKWNARLGSFLCKIVHQISSKLPLWLRDVLSTSTVLSLASSAVKFSLCMKRCNAARKRNKDTNKNKIKPYANPHVLMRLTVCSVCLGSQTPKWILYRSNFWI